MITGFTISNVEGKISDVTALQKQRFPRLNISLDNLNVKSDKINITYTFLADYFDGDGKDAKNLGQIKLGGVIEIQESKEVVSAVTKKWNESHKLPVQMAEEVVNGLNFRCSATGTLVAYSLGLIPPLVISTTKIQDEGA
ncbi:MAG: hypothetical protein M1158_02230 [Candidatus Marsarchaeota archaeon]|jgi:hypothetical protein|nr:hypothetical protein [Candidatus Marsarchaeota archaeon]